MKNNGKQATSCEKEPQAVGKLSSFERNVGAERASSPTTSVVAEGRMVLEGKHEVVYSICRRYHYQSDGT